MYETSGVLIPAVKRYLQGVDITGQDLAALRAYVRQWIYSPVWDCNPNGTGSVAGLRDMVDSITTRAQLDLWTERAGDIGIDPW